MTLNYSNKHYLIPADTWHRLKQGEIGGPQLQLKKTYQDFMERKRAQENETDQKWSALSNRVTPMISEALSRSRETTGLEQDLLVDKLRPKAKLLYQALEKMNGVEIDWSSSKIIVDGHPLVGSINDILKQLLAKRSEKIPTANLIPLLKKMIANKFDKKDKIINMAALHYIHSNTPAPMPPPVRRKGQSASNAAKGKTALTYAAKNVLANAAKRNLNKTAYGAPSSEKTPDKNAPSSSGVQQRHRRSSRIPPAPPPNNRRQRVTPNDVKIEFVDDNQQAGSGIYYPIKKGGKLTWKSLF